MCVGVCAVNCRWKVCCCRINIVITYIFESAESVICELEEQRVAT